MSHVRTVAIAERALCAAHGASVALALAEVVVDYPGAAAILLRCMVNAPGSTDLPTSVIVKESRSRPSPTSCRQSTLATSTLRCW